MIHADSVSFLTSTDDRIILFYFISFAQKNKQTNKQTERTLAGTPQQLWPITAGPDTNKKKSTAIQEKLQLNTTSYWTRQGTRNITF